MKLGKAAGPSGVVADMLKAAARMEQGGWLSYAMQWLGMVKSQRIGVGVGWWMFTRGREMHWNVARTEE